MRDQNGRKIEYMRISITDRCNLNCVYCKPEETVHLKHEEILSYEEILRIMKCARKLGIYKFRITGGEPTMRKGYLNLLRMIQEEIPDAQVFLTSNGLLLDETALAACRKYGICGINYSLDTLDSQRYQQITGSGSAQSVQQVVESMDIAQKYDIPIKINAVLLADLHKEDFFQLLERLRNRQTALRFIEQMPMGSEITEKSLVTGETLLQWIRQEGYEVCETREHPGNGPAHYVRISGFQGLLGFIEPIHGKFCNQCNRVRLTSTGFLKTCLYHEDGVQLRTLLRENRTEEEIQKAMEQAIYHKPKQHHFECQGTLPHMNMIGG